MSHAYSNVETFVPRLSPAPLSSMRKDMVDLTPFFPPEGQLLHTPENRAACASSGGLLQAMAAGTVLEGTALLCDQEHNLTVSLGNGILGTIPREEAALGIAEGTTRDIAILSRVGRPVAFLVEDIGLREGTLHPILSRRRAQRLALDALLSHARPGTVLPAVVSHLEPFGAFVDLGCGVTSMIGIEHISVSRISHPGQRFYPGQAIFVVVLDLDPEQERIYLTHRELLGTWSENAAPFRPGMTVPGIVRGIKEYGAFIELAPNLSGLAEMRDGLQEGQRVSVFIKSIVPEKMKIKLLIIDLLPPEPPAPLSYFITGGQLTHWRYAPEGCTRVGAETVFLAPE